MKNPKNPKNPRNPTRRTQRTQPKEPEEPKNPRTRRTQEPIKGKEPNFFFEEPSSSWKNPVLLGRTCTRIRYLGAGTQDGFENPTPRCGNPCNIDLYPLLLLNRKDQGFWHIIWLEKTISKY